MSAAALVETEVVDGVLVATVTVDTISEYESGQIVEHVQRAAGGHGWRVVMDFVRVSFLSSPGISMILTLMHDAKKGKGKFVICSLNEDIMDVLRMTMVEKTLNIASCRAEAMKKV